MKRRTAALMAAVLAGLLALPVTAAPEDPAAEPGGPAARPAEAGEGGPGAPPGEEGPPPVTTYQADAGYSGPLDPVTGLPMDRAGSPALAGASFGYDPAGGYYVNPVGSKSFTSSVPSGTVLPAGKSVSFLVPAGLSATLYRNGDAVENAELSNITREGGYVLQVLNAQGETASFPFQIVPKLTNALTELSLPTGFTFDYVTLDGDGLTPEYANYLELLVDGTYGMSWSCAEIGQSYELSFTLDTKAPTLALPEAVNGEAHGPVTLADLEEGAYIRVERDGEAESPITSPDTVLQDAGRYVLTVFDRAGNSTRYELMLHVYLNLSAWTALAMLLALVLGLAGYSRYVYTHPRVG